MHKFCVQLHLTFRFAMGPECIDPRVRLFRYVRGFRMRHSNDATTNQKFSTLIRHVSFAYMVAKERHSINFTLEHPVHNLCYTYARSKHVYLRFPSRRTRQRVKPAVLSPPVAKAWPVELSLQRESIQRLKNFQKVDKTHLAAPLSKAKALLTCGVQLAVFLYKVDCVFCASIMLLFLRSSS